MTFQKKLFNKTIIKATHDLVCSYKLNTAFYESIGHEGVNALKDTCDYLVKKYPEVPIIIDAKRADIGSTNKGYVQFLFTYLSGDAVTVHPYLGEEAIRLLRGIIFAQNPRDEAMKLRNEINKLI